MARSKSTGDVEPAAAPKRLGDRRHSSMAAEGPSDTPAARTSKASKGKGNGGGRKKARLQVEEEQQEQQDMLVAQDGDEEAALFFIDREESAAGASAAPHGTEQEDADADEGEFLCVFGR